MYYGGRLKGECWNPRRWKALKESLEEHLLTLLSPLRALIVAVDEQIAATEKSMAAIKSASLPKGMGMVSFQ